MSSDKPWCAQQVAFPESTCIRPLCNSPAHSVCTLFGLVDKLSVTLSTTTRTSRRSTVRMLVMARLSVILASQFLLKESRRFKNLHITKSSNCCKVIPILGYYRRFPTPSACCYESIEGQALRNSRSESRQPASANSAPTLSKPVQN